MSPSECYQTGKLCQKSIKEKTKIATLIRDKCLMDCQPGDVPSTVLLDTRSQVFNFSGKCLKINFVTTN